MKPDKNVMERFNFLINECFFGRKRHVHPVRFHLKTWYVSFVVRVGMLSWGDQKGWYAVLGTVIFS